VPILYSEGERRRKEMAEVWFKLSEQQPEEYEVVNVKDFGMAWYSRDTRKAKFESRHYEI